MRKILGLFVLLSLLIATGSIALANSSTVVSDRSIAVPQPNLPVKPLSIAAGPQHETTKLPETLNVPELPQPGIPVEVAMDLETVSSETGTDCLIGWYPCQDGTMLCYGWGCPSYACGPCDPNVAGGAPGIASCEGWTWNGSVSVCVCKSAEGTVIINASCPAACSASAER